MSWISNPKMTAVMALCLAAAVPLAAMVQGCTQKQAQVASVVECDIKVLAPYLGDIADSVLTDVLAHKTNVVTILTDLGVPLLEAQTVQDALNKCKPEDEIIKAPPPGYGDKVL